jgi:hypothetical protein
LTAGEIERVKVAHEEEGDKTQWEAVNGISSGGGGSGKILQSEKLTERHPVRR